MCGTWFLTLRNRHRWKLSGNEELKGIFGFKNEEETGEHKKLETRRSIIYD
jgi:hypothetical protein